MTFAESENFYGVSTELLLVFRHLARNGDSADSAVKIPRAQSYSSIGLTFEKESPQKIAPYVRRDKSEFLGLSLSHILSHK